MELLKILAQKGELVNLTEKVIIVLCAENWYSFTPEEIGPVIYLRIFECSNDLIILYIHIK